MAHNSAKEASVFINRWLYSKPKLTPNKDGDIVLICKSSFGPLEVWEWGLDVNNIPYEDYQWCEDDFFADLSGRKPITAAELIKVIQSTCKLYDENDLSEWSDILRNAQTELKF